MKSETLGQISACLQKDCFEKESEKLISFQERNPLLLLARTCQNIGVETNSSENLKEYTPSSTSSSLSYFSFHCQSESAVFTSSPMSSVFSSVIPDRSFPPKTCPPCSPIGPQPLLRETPTPTGEFDKKQYSNSLVQLARLSSNLHMSPERHKRSKFSENKAISFYTRQHRRIRRPSFSRNKQVAQLDSSKPIDYTFAHRSEESSQDSQSSTVSPTNIKSFCQSGVNTLLSSPQFADNNCSTTSCLDSCFSLVNALGVPVEILKHFLMILSQASTSQPRNAAETKHNKTVLLEQTLKLNNGVDTICTDSQLYENYPEQFIRPALGAFASSEQSETCYQNSRCLYCGILCSDINNLVQHIYTHLSVSEHEVNQTPSTKNNSHGLPNLAKCFHYPTVERNVPFSNNLSMDVNTSGLNEKVASYVPGDKFTSIYEAWLQMFRLACLQGNGDQLS